MKIRHLLPTVLLFGVWVGPSVAADVTGTWRVTISTADGEIVGVATLEQKGDEVTGRLGPVEDPTIRVAGTVKEHRLTMKTYPQPGRVVAFDQCDLTVSEDEMTGTIDRRGAAKNGTIRFVRTTRQSIP